MVNITHATPRNVNLGVDDQSIKEIRPLDIMPILPQHLPLFFLFTQKGTYAKCIVDYETFDIIYGAESLRLGSKYYNHNAHMAKAILATGNSVVVKRMKVIAPGTTAGTAIVLDSVDNLIPTIDISLYTGRYVLIDGEIVYIVGYYTVIDGVLYWVDIDGVLTRADEYVIGTLPDGTNWSGGTGTGVGGSTFTYSYFEVPGGGSVDTVYAVEGGDITFEILLGNIIAGTTVRFSTLPGTATLGVDYAVDGFTYSVDDGAIWSIALPNTPLTITDHMLIRTDTAVDSNDEGIEYFGIVITVVQEGVEYSAVGIAGIGDLVITEGDCVMIYDSTILHDCLIPF